MAEVRIDGHAHISKIPKTYFGEKRQNIAHLRNLHLPSDLNHDQTSASKPQPKISIHLLLNLVQYGFVKVVTWISLSCYMDLLKLMYEFL